MILSNEWSFLSRNHGETEGFSNGSLAEFKGNPIQSLAREICQNSLDAADGSGKPVIVEFENKRIDQKDFPGMDSMKKVILSCYDFWKTKSDVNTLTFLNRAKDCLKKTDFSVLRISDYNTTGVPGAFSNDDITPWGGLVKGNAFSVKTDAMNAAGSYGIGKAAPFVSSFFQTVFYRTIDNTGERAALGVARLMAHESICTIPANEDKVRRSVGYYGSDELGKPSHSIPELDQLNTRDKTGTDLFIPGFIIPYADKSWITDILREIIDNFLYSIYNNKLEIHIEGKIVNRDSLDRMIEFVGSKDARMFYSVIKDNPQVLEEKRDFHKLGDLRLRLLFDKDLNKKVLIVRNSGMKIAKISSLPRTISFSGFLELQGPQINSFFRSMENPSHNAWEPKRHGKPELAKQYKEEVEEWVRNKITEKLIDISGEQQAIDIGNCFSSSSDDQPSSSQNTNEAVSNNIELISTDVYVPSQRTSSRINIKDEGRNNRNEKVAAKEDPNGTHSGTRGRTGKKTRTTIGNRKVNIDPTGPDTAFVGVGGKLSEVWVKARIITSNDGYHKLIITPENNITKGKIEIVCKGENGKSLRLVVNEVRGENVEIDNGAITILNLAANTKFTCEFSLKDKHNYAMGVKAFEYKE